MAVCKLAATRSREPRLVVMIAQEELRNEDDQQVGCTLFMLAALAVPAVLVDDVVVGTETLHPATPKPRSASACGFC